MKLTNAQRLLCEQLRPVAVARGMHVIPEHAAIPGRRFRIDVALVEPVGLCWTGYAIEIDGGLFMKRSRHAGGVGQVRDMEQANLLTEHRVS